MKRFYQVLVVLSLWSCQKEFLTPEELNVFVSDDSNGCVSSVKAGATNVTVQYRPTDLLVHQEVGDNPAEPAKIAALREKYSPYYYFILSLSHNNKEALHQTGGAEYSELVQTLSFRMSEYVSMTTVSGDTIPVSDFMLNRTYGMSSTTDVLFVFSKEKAAGKEWIQFNLNEFGLGVGNQRFRFETRDLEGTPKVKFMDL
jgi:hypothetical protein